MIDKFPEAFETRMRSSLGTSWDLFAAAHAAPSPTAVRINPAKHKPVHPTAVVPWSRYGMYLPERPVFTLDPELHGGAYYVQEPSSMFLEQAFLQVLQRDSPVTVLDLCAAPGGKSTHLLSLLNSDSLLVSNEVIRSRASILHENIQKWGNSNVVVTNNDPADFQRLEGFFDIIVVDAPCSGEGLFRKDPQAANQWSEDNVRLCAKRQRRILADVWPALKENGIVIYSTCTYSEAENEENLAWLKSSCDVEFLPLDLDDAWGVQPSHEHGISGYRMYPHKANGEGFFISVIRKKEKQAQSRAPKNTFFSPSKKIVEQLSHWVKASEDFIFIQRDTLLQFFPARHIHALEHLAKELRLLSAGTFVATMKHDKLIPEHAMALSQNLNRDNFACLSMSLEQALAYLRKETIDIPLPEKGFALVRYEELPLGWVNVLQNRINNLYPSEWRIRMADQITR